jgi:hypothetical protein
MTPGRPAYKTSKRDSNVIVMSRLRVAAAIVLVALVGLLVPARPAGAQGNGQFQFTVTFGGAPLQGLAIIVNSSASDPRGYINSGGPNVTDGNGRFDLSLPAGTYDLHVAEKETNNVVYGSQVIYEVRINAGQAIPVNFELQRPVGAITGRVLRPNGAPAAGVQVDAFGTFALGDTEPFGWGGVATAADGTYTLRNLLPNRAYAVFVPALGYRMDYVPVNAGSSTPSVDFPSATGVYPGGQPSPAPAPTAPAPSSGPEGRMFGLGADGSLRWYRHADPGGGAYNWVGTNFGNLVGEGWNAFDDVWSGGNGVLYTVKDGVLRWHRNTDPGGGTYSWAATNFGNIVGEGWGDLLAAVPNGDGTIYAVRPNGDLIWFRHTGVNDGTYSYAAGSGAKIGDGFDQCERLIGGGNGVLYCVRANGDLQYWHHTSPLTGAASWAGGTIVGNGWGNVQQMWSGGSGVIYTIDSAGNLRWYRHTGFADGTYSWAGTNFGATIGEGWNKFSSILTGGLA